MTKIDVISGFLGAGKTTLIKKLLKEVLNNTKVVLIENEFGEIGIDGGFLKESGIEIKEMNSGCICCSLVGDFGTSLREVLTTYQPEHILIEPSGVGKLSDVLIAIENVSKDLDVEISSAITVVDAQKCKMYSKNFGEFFLNQVECAGAIFLSRTENMPQQKLETTLDILRTHNKKAVIVTTPWDQLDGEAIIQTMEGTGKMEDILKTMLLDEMSHEEEHEHCDHDHEDHDHEDHSHHDHEDHDHHDHGEHDHHDHEDHDHHDHHDHEDHDHHDHHDHDHHHHHHHADEIFTSWGVETPKQFTKEQIDQILKELDTGKYGNILRSKGMISNVDGSWIYFDYVPEEHELRGGKPDVIGKICVIGEHLREEALKELFLS
jgi:G3E family GTPase